MKLTRKLKQLLIASVFLHWLHFIEVVVTKFYLEESFLSNLADVFDDVRSATYFSSHVVLYVLLTVLVLMLLKPNLTKYFLTVYSWIFIAETHHFLVTATSLKYYPGSITSFMYVILGFMYVRQIVRDWKTI